MEGNAEREVQNKNVLVEGTFRDTQWLNSFETDDIIVHSQFTYDESGAVIPVLRNWRFIFDGSFILFVGTNEVCDTAKMAEAARLMTDHKNMAVVLKVLEVGDTIGNKTLTLTERGYMNSATYILMEIAVAKKIFCHREIRMAVKYTEAVINRKHNIIQSYFNHPGCLRRNFSTLNVVFKKVEHLRDVQKAFEEIFEDQTHENMAMARKFLFFDMLKKDAVEVCRLMRNRFVIFDLSTNTRSVASLVWCAYFIATMPNNVIVILKNAYATESLKGGSLDDENKARQYIFGLCLAYQIDVVLKYDHVAEKIENKYIESPATDGIWVYHFVI